MGPFILNIFTYPVFEISITPILFRIYNKNSFFIPIANGHVQNRAIKEPIYFVNGENVVGCHSFVHFRVTIIYQIQRTNLRFSQSDLPVFDLLDTTTLCCSTPVAMKH